MEGATTLTSKDFDTLVIDQSKLGGSYYLHKFRGNVDWYGMTRVALLAITIEVCAERNEGLDVGIHEVEELNANGANIRPLEPKRCSGLGDDPTRAIRMAYRIASELKSGYAQ